MLEKMVNNRAAKFAVSVILGVAGAFSSSGCAISAGYTDGNERVDMSIVGAPLVGAAEVKHKFYTDSGHSEIEHAFYSSVVGSLLTGGAFEMKIHEQKDKFSWMYRIETIGVKDGNLECKLKVWDSDRNSSEWIYSIPDYLPGNISVRMSGNSFSNLYGTTTYSNLKGHVVDPEYLVTDEAKKFVKDKVKNKK